MLDCVLTGQSWSVISGEKEGAKVEVREGVYDRLSEGTFETAAEAHAAEKGCVFTSWGGKARS